MRSTGRYLIGIGLAVIVAGAAGFAWLTHPVWLPSLQKWTETPKSAAKEKKDAHGHAHDDANSVELSRQARLNIGLTDDMIRPIKLKPVHDRTISVPAVVATLPGKTEIKVVAPMTGVVTDVYTFEGENVAPGKPLFKIRLLHEDLVQSQTDYLKSLGSLDVEEKEIQRLAKLTKEGALAEKVLLQRKYEKYKLEAVLRAQHEALLLHGLSEEQVNSIAKDRKLLSTFVVHAPALPAKSGEIQPVVGPASPATLQPRRAKSEDSAPPLIVHDLKVTKGDYVTAGSPLCVLSDYSRLHIEGRAFEQDANELARATSNQWPVTAVLEDGRNESQKIEGLKIVYLEHEVEPDSRAFHFYVGLPNQLLHKTVSSKEPQFVTWRFKPGQRMQVLVPVKKWKNRIVLPVDAVAKDGVEYYVFLENGDHFERRPVHVEYKDQFWVVIANDGSVFPGDRVAFTGAHQLSIALKNKAGAGADAHHGHVH